MLPFVIKSPNVTAKPHICFLNDPSKGNVKLFKKKYKKQIKETKQKERETFKALHFNSTVRMSNTNLKNIKNDHQTSPVKHYSLIFTFGQ